jgi:glucose-6-phosphate isomerase
MKGDRMLKKINPTHTASWEKLLRHYKEMKNTHLRELFAAGGRFKKFSITFDDILFDYSKNRVNETTMELLVLLADEMAMGKAIASMFDGDRINETENRPVLHTALRDFKSKSLKVDGTDILPAIKAVRDKMRIFSDAVRSGQWKGYTGKKITDVVNIGIGGSDLGPYMVCEALKFYADGPAVHFVSNVDGTHITETLKKLDPETTLFLIASKTFTTQETMTNAFSAREWFLKKAKSEKHIRSHFAALSTNGKKVVEFGIGEENMFEFWDFVGGRYSLWSAIGMPVALSVGYDKFEELLKGAGEMDNHFRTAPFSKNIPVIMGLIGVWYSDFFGSECEAVLPYDQYLHRFPAFLQQLSMESNGKTAARDGSDVDYRTGQILFGEPGTNGQHSFYQLIHQGTHTIPSDFLCARTPLNSAGDHHEKLLSNFLAQTEALAFGKTKDEAVLQLEQAGMNSTEIRKLYPHKIFAGNIPTTSIVYDKLTPSALGRIIAMYEHKVFVQGVIWNIFSFDQWGVELGKELASKILKELTAKKSSGEHDSSTEGLIKHLVKKGGK